MGISDFSIINCTNLREGFRAFLGHNSVSFLILQTIRFIYPIRHQKNHIVRFRYWGGSNHRNVSKRIFWLHGSPFSVLVSNRILGDNPSAHFFSQMKTAPETDFHFCTGHVDGSKIRLATERMMIIP